MSTPDLVNNPPHYTNGPPCPGCGRTIQMSDVARHLPYALGSAIKYLWRVGFGGKAGVDPVEDLGKAGWYVEDRRKQLTGERVLALTEPAPTIKCALCGHSGPKLTECGFGLVEDDGGNQRYLCQHQTHDCYREWVEHGVRP